jgi:CTP-dependent riboflavin kinase
MGERWVIVRGIVARGHRVASGESDDRRYPRGTIEMQKPFFKALGLDLTPFYEGTLNVSISPHTFAMVRPRYTYRHVEWTSLHPPEDFSFSPCRVLFDDAVYEGWIYYPHPETKKVHFQDPSIVEIIAPYIPNIGYGDEVQIMIDANEVSLDQKTD